jgi:hypothetical protein
VFWLSWEINFLGAVVEKRKEAKVEVAKWLKSVLFRRLGNNEPRLAMKRTVALDDYRLSVPAFLGSAALLGTRAKS